MTRTPRRLAVAGLSVILLLSGCGQGQLRAGAAAVVGSDRIDTAALQQMVDRGLADPAALQQLGADRPTYQRLILTRLINRDLLEAAADELGVNIEQGDVDGQVAAYEEQAGGRQQLEKQAAQIGVAPQDLNDFVRDTVLEQRVGDSLTKDVQVPEAQLRQLYAQNIAKFDRVRSRHILVADEALARRLLGQVRADPSRFAALAAQYSTDTSNKDRGGDLGLQGRGQFVPEFEKALFDSPVGSYQIVQTQFGWHVVNIQQRQTTSLQDATPELRRTLLQQQQAQTTGEVLARTADRLGVTVSPRFGRWDPKTLTVAVRDQLGGVISPAPGSGGPGTAPGGTAPNGTAPQPVPSPAG